ncbi:MAG: relaxase/mobilization nuclease domain-containing protein [Pseudomonadota bacterium]
MILKGSQRGGALDLADHLLRTDENEHVEVHRLRGFAAQDLVGALNETYAVSRGTRCKQFMFSVIFNPPPSEEVKTEDFEAAIECVEKRFGLSEQPCAVVFHEKEGRRHAHAVWSRIDTEQMKAVQLSYFKNKLQSISRELFLEHGWTMPRGFVNSAERDPKNFTLDEWQHSKRIGKDPRQIKAAIQDAWAISDSRAAFEHALRERGYRLARGDSAAFVAVDYNGEAFAIARSLPKGIKTKQVRQRLGDETDLPSVSEVQKQIANDMLGTMRRLQAEFDRQNDTTRIEIERRKSAMIVRQSAERRKLAETQEQSQAEESQTRQARLRRGFKGLWDRLSGRHRRTCEMNEREADAARDRDQRQKDALIQAHLSQRRKLQNLIDQSSKRQSELRREVEAGVSRYIKLKENPAPDRTDRKGQLGRARTVRRRPRRRGSAHEIDM